MALMVAAAALCHALSSVPLVWSLPAASSPVLIVAPIGSEDTCPSARQVTEALQTHFPGQILSPERLEAPPRPDLLRAVLDVPADGTVVHFSLIDSRDEVQLRRSIPAPGRGRPPSDCLALAETLAVIVDRYLSSVPYQATETAPPPPPVAVAEPPRHEGAKSPPRSTQLYLGGSWQLSSGNPSLLEGRGGADRDIIVTPWRLAALLRVGFSQEERVEWRTSSTTLRRFPVRIGLRVEFPVGPGALESALEAGVDALVGRSSDSLSGKAEEGVRWSPVVGGEAGYRVALTDRLFVRPRVGLAFAIVRYNIAAGSPETVVFQTPTLFSTLGLDVGMVFR